MEEQLQQQEPASSALLRRIAACRTLQELKTLLLSKAVTIDEQLMAAFDQRIEALEQQTGQPFIH
jgi:hypothetical protein